MPTATLGAPSSATPSPRPVPQLVVVGSGLAAPSVDLREPEVTIGRSESCVIVVSRPLVSRLHARLVLSGGRYEIQDAGSSNGTYLNGQRVLAAMVLRHGDQIGIAGPEPLFKFTDPDGTFARPDMLRFDLELQLFFFRDHTLQLSQNEFKLLLHLHANVGRICTRESCVYAVWRARTGIDGYRGALDQFIYQIRGKLLLIDPRADLIKTIRGEGYMLEL